jgi:PAT family beta-lactamase induction signal transducer AmpG
VTSVPRSTRSPWVFVPTLYFAEGVPYVLVNSVSVILYKQLGVTNAAIAFWTSLLYLPWVLKMLWGPLVDQKGTKRAWILATQFVMTVCLAALATTIGLPGFFAATLAVFTLAAFVSATHDIAADGFYLLALDDRRQALFVGVRTLFYRAAMIFGSGLLVTLAGRLERETGGVPRAWTTAFAFAAALYGGLWLYHRAALPRLQADRPADVPRARGVGANTNANAGAKAHWRTVFGSWFGQPRIAAIVAFILFFRLGEAMLLKLASPFLLDSREAGGLGLTTAQVGVAYGTVGPGCLILGGITGGWLIARFGLRRMLWPLALTLNLPHAAYLYLAHAQPGPALAYPLVALEQLGYGLGSTAFMVYLMRVSRGEHRTSHFAIATGLMALGMMLPGMVSGAIQEAIGYRAFFLLVLALGLPGLAVLPLLPRLADAGSGDPVPR